MDVLKLLRIFIAFGCLKCASADCDSACMDQCRVSVEHCRKPLQDHKTGNKSDVISAEHDLEYCYYTDDQLDKLCSLHREAMRCLENDVAGLCFETSPELRDIRFKNSDDTNDFCVYDKKPVCDVKFSRCMCHLAGANGKLAFCSGFKPFIKCVESQLKECMEDPAWQQGFAETKRANNVFYQLNCREAGGCQEAVHCLLQLDYDEQNDNITSGPTVATWPETDIPNVCRKISVFDCLGSATAACHIDQGGVTMDEMKSAISEACTDVFSLITSNATCESFLDCHKNFSLVPTKDEDPDAAALSSFVRYVASTTRTGFWYSWLKYNYQCAIENAKACNLSASVVSLGQQKLDELEKKFAVSTSDSASIFTAPLCLLSVSVLGTFFLQMGVADHIVSTL